MTSIQRIFLICVLFSSTIFSLVAQPVNEKGVNYQAVLSQSGNILANQEVQFRFTLRQEGSFVSYQEEHVLITDDRGRVSTIIGTGKSGFKDFSQVDWTDPELSLQVEVDADESGYKELSNEPLQAVPFSYMANEVLNLPEITLDSLANVEISGVERGQFLQWTGKNWAPGDDTNPWTQVEEETISYTGKIGLNNALPDSNFDIHSKGTFQHEGSFRIINNNIPNMGVFSSSPYSSIWLGGLKSLSGERATLGYSAGTLSLEAEFSGGFSSGIHILANGLIGIDDQTPSEKLDVAGAIKIGNTTRTNNGTIRWTGSDFEGRKAGSWVSLTSQAVSTPPSVWNLDQGNGSISYRSGFVGLGIDEPTQRLTVYENNNKTNQGQLLLTQAGNGDVMINMGVGKGRHYALGIDNSDGDRFKIGTNEFGVNGVDSRTSLTIQPDGNLGVGTTAPKRKLTITQDHGNTSAQSHLLLEQLGNGDAWMNFSVDGTFGVRSYAMGIDNSDNDSFKIGISDEGDINGVGENTILELTSSSDVIIKDELNRENTGSADLVPVAYGSFEENGLIDQSKSTGNFSVKRITTGSYQIILTTVDRNPDRGYLIIANTAVRGIPEIAQSSETLEEGPPPFRKFFWVRTYELLPTTKQGDAVVNFVIYKP
ncbi:MAG: hypothetical protein AAF655_26285 [Bacteroidota bacterium]